MAEKLLGKIEHVKFGKGGYQDCMIGLSLTFAMNGSGVGHFINGGWTLKRSPDAKWTEADRNSQRAALVAKVVDLLEQAKVDDVSKLKGIPVEVELEGNQFKDFRILTEVL